MHSPQKNSAVAPIDNRHCNTRPLRTLRNFLATLLLSTLPQYGFAIPYVDSLEVLQDKWNTIAYARIVWPPEDSSEIICNSFVGCSITPCMKSTFGICQGDMEKQRLYVDNGTTMSQARQLWVNQFGSISREFRFNQADKGTCVTLATGAASNIALPSMTCAPLPPINLTCTMSDNLNLAYNTLGNDAVNNAQASGTITILCNGWANVKIRLVGPTMIDLGRNGALRATLHTQGTNLANGYAFRGYAQPTTITITSTLISTEQIATEGTFSGQGIIIMLYD